VAVAVLLLLSGSYWSEWKILAVLTCWSGLTTTPSRASVSGAAVVTVPTVQRPVVLS